MAKLVITFFLIFAIFALIKADSSNEQALNEDEELLNWTVPEELKKYPCKLMGYDYENRAVILLEWGKWNTTEITQSGGQILEDLEKMWDQFIERLRIGFYQKPTNHNEDTKNDEFVLLMDLDRYDYSQLLSQPNTKFLARYFTKLNKAYGKFAYGFFVNVSPVGEYFATMFKLVAGKYIDGSEMNGTNKRLWKPRLLKKIPKNQLLPNYGGEAGYKSVGHCVKFSNPKM